MIKQALNLLLDEDSFVSLVKGGLVPDWLPQDHRDIKKVITYVAGQGEKSRSGPWASARQLVNDAEAGRRGAMLLMNAYRDRLLTAQEYEEYRTLGLGSLLTPAEQERLTTLEMKSGRIFAVAMQEFMEDFIADKGQDLLTSAVKNKENKNVTSKESSSTTSSPPRGAGSPNLPSFRG